MAKVPFGGKKGFLWVTLVLFVTSLAGQFIFSWFVYKHDQEQHDMPVEVGEYLNETLKDMFENWQSEFMQLIWQVVGLAALWYVGSSQSKEGDDRKEEKIDLILEKVYGDKEAEKIKRELARKYPKE